MLTLNDSTHYTHNKVPIGHPHAPGTRGAVESKADSRPCSTHIARVRELHPQAPLELAVDLVAFAEIVNVGRLIQSV